MQLVPRIAVVCCVGLFAGCGGGGGGDVVSVPPPPPQTLQTLSGRTGQPVNAEVESGANGDVVIRAPGFFTFETTLRGQGIVYLWPANDGYMSAQYTRAPIYELHAGSVAPGIIRRPADSIRRMTLNLTSSRLESSDVLGAVDRAVEMVNRAYDGALDVVVGSGGVFPVNVSLDPTDPIFSEHPEWAAVTYNEFQADGFGSGGLQVSSRILLRGITEYTQGMDGFVKLMAHEIGHATGVQGHLDPAGEQGIMAGTAQFYSFADFTEREKVLFRMLRRRVPGTRLIDMTENDRSGSVRSAGRGHPTQWQRVCGM